MAVNTKCNGCENCLYKEDDVNFGLICTHKASMEGIEASKCFYEISEVKDCKYYTEDNKR